MSNSEAAVSLIASFRSALYVFFDSRLQDSTQLRYATSRDHFEAWCVRHGIRTAVLSDDELDVVLAKCMLDGKEDDDFGRQFFVDMFAAVSKRARTRLKFASKVSVAWLADDPPLQADALPVEAALACAVVCSLCMQEDAVGVFVMLAFFGILRIGEVLALRGADVILPRDASQPQIVILIIRLSKRGFDQRVVVNDPRAVSWIVSFAAKHSVGADDYFAVCSYSKFSRIFGVAMRFLQLAGHWRTHSLRRGGATHLAELGYAFKDIQLAGRWASDASCREYIRRGQTALLRLRASVGSPVWTRIESFGSIGSRSLSL